jgi:carbamoyltransferase
VVYYDNAPQTFERLMHTQLAIAPNGENSWNRILPSWTRFKLQLPQLIRRQLQYDGLLLHEEHHRSHAASAFYPSPFSEAAILTIDGVGEWATASIGIGRSEKIQMLKQMNFPHSLGLLYSAFTQFTGFKVNSGEYKMMGLAPYGEPKYVAKILRELVNLKDDGSIELNLNYFGFLNGDTMTNEHFAELFGGPARKPDDWITQREMDLARSIQVVTEECLLRMGRYVHGLTGLKKLCLAGGVALNCVANGRLLREGPFDGIWIQPAAGDSGCALGAALDVYHTYFGKPRVAAANKRSLQKGSCLGPQFSENEIAAYLNTHGYPHRLISKRERAESIAKLLAQGKVIGHFSGRVEFGPRALGSRSIIGDPRNEEMQATLNLKIKYRESFRPFAPTVLAEKVSDYFELKTESPYMLLVAAVKKERCHEFQRLPGEDLTKIVKQRRSDIPAVTHVDYSARIQTIAREDHPEYYDLIQAFEKISGCGVIVNTSFNVRGEPIICTPHDAYRCFMRTEMDALVLGDFLLLKEEQPAWPESKGHVETHDESAPVLEDSGFFKALQKIYRADFLKAAANAKADCRVSTDFSKSKTTWSDHANSHSAESIFCIPPELDSSEPDAAAMAQAVTQFWSEGAAREALRPVVEKLLKTGQRYAASEEIEERVSDSIYVMY